MPPDTAATATALAAVPTGPPGTAGRRPLAVVPLAVAEPSLEEPEPEDAPEPVDLDRPDRRDRAARRRRTLVLIGLVVLGLVATATLMVAGEMFLRDPTTHTIPFLSSAGNGPVVEPRHRVPGQPGKGGPAVASSQPSHRPSTAPSQVAPSTPPSAAARQPESANGSPQPGPHWVCTMTRRSVNCVPVPGGSPAAPPSDPDYSWSDRHER